MKTVKCSGFIIRYEGDRSVGMFPAEWTVSGDFEFETESELNTFKQELAGTWELISDTPLFVETYEERNERIRQEEGLFEVPQHLSGQYR